MREKRNPIDGLTRREFWRFALVVIVGYLALYGLGLAILGPLYSG